MRILVTGASGFIGSAFIRRVLDNPDFEPDTIVGLIRYSSSKNLQRVEDFIDHPNFVPVFGDLNGDISGLCERVDWVVHFAARTFVDHSILDPRPFVEANVLATLNLLEDARRYKVKRYIQVSTDEVYGAILDGKWTEDSRLNPTNPYSATKAGGDALAIAYAHTFGLHTNITRTENNYGPWQHCQKAMPVFIRAALHGEKLPVYGDGLHVRQWLYVDDHVDAILQLLVDRNREVKPGEVYHVAGNQELTNIELAKRLVIEVRKQRDCVCSEPNNWDDCIELIADHNIRPGHDRRYALDCSKLMALGWKPKVSLEEGIRKTVEWYREHPEY